MKKAFPLLLLNLLTTKFIINSTEFQLLKMQLDHSKISKKFVLENSLRIRKETLWNFILVFFVISSKFFSKKKNLETFLKHFCREVSGQKIHC